MRRLMDPLTTALGELGFSPYEARAYAALVARSPANGYEVAKAAAIPTSKIYETLQRLQQRGASRRFFGSGPLRRDPARGSARGLAGSLC